MKLHDFNLTSSEPRQFTRIENAAIFNAELECAKQILEPRRVQKKNKKTEVDETEIIFPQSMVIKQQTRFLGLSREWNILN